MCAGKLRLCFECKMKAEMLWLLIMAASALPGTKAVSEGANCNSEVQTTICLPSNYSSMDIPFTDQPNEILIEIHISDVLVINDRDFSITYSLYFNVQWKEPRMQLNDEFFQDRSDTQDNNSMSPVDLNLINDLWVPNVFIYNLKTFKVIDVLSRLAGLWVSPEKEIMYSQATHITFICAMLFDYFPLDTQVCKFQVGSYSYNMDKMIFKVSQLGYAHTSRSIVLDYDIDILPLDEADTMFDGGSLGNYSLAGFTMILNRHVSHYIITYYLPSGLFVVVSWISFLVPCDVIPGRMALLVTLFLVLVNIFNTVTTNTPKAEGLTAIEAWMLACILFVFGALIEYAGLLFHKMSLVTAPPPPKVVKCPTTESLSTVCANTTLMEHNSADNDTNGKAEGERLTMDSLSPCPPPPPPRSKEQLEAIRKKMYAQVDRFFLVTFPVMFMGFNAIYWLTYLKPNWHLQLKTYIGME